MMVEIFSTPTNLSEIGARIVAALGRRSTRCEAVTVTDGMAAFDVVYHGERHTLTTSAPAAGMPPGVPAFRRAAVLEHLRAAAELAGSEG